jgi:excisionase family DNA binding protein
MSQGCLPRPSALRLRELAASAGETNNERLAGDGPDRSTRHLTRWTNARKLDGRLHFGTVSNGMNELESEPMVVLLKPTAVAERLGVSRTWLYDAAKTGRIPSIRVGGDDGPLRFVPEDIQRWLDEARAQWTPGRSTRATRSPATAGSVSVRDDERSRV